MATPRVTAPLVKGFVDDHITKHKDVYDKMMVRHEVLLVGEKGDDGLCLVANNHETRIENIEKIGDKIDKAKWAVIIAAAADIVSRFVLK